MSVNQAPRALLTSPEGWHEYSSFSSLFEGYSTCNMLLIVQRCGTQSPEVVLGGFRAVFAMP